MTTNLQVLYFKLQLIDEPIMSLSIHSRKNHVALNRTINSYLYTRTLSFFFCWRGQL